VIGVSWTLINIGGDNTDSSSYSDRPMGPPPIAISTGEALGVEHALRFHRGGSVYDMFYRKASQISEPKLTWEKGVLALHKY
jgi:hypothetical protein